ncbi:MAG: tetratricopeptide repeat protein [Leptonema sp. (in: Bacteria)]|nr:tetratricopeptide repeat protein [Leptonema sp. (in: bacteria)]
MNSRQIYYFTTGFILFAIGLLAIGLDYGKMRADLSSSVIQEGQIADSRGEGHRPKPYTDAELRSEMLRAEEYLRQNSKESAQKAMEIYNSILSYDTDAKVNQVARFGLATSLYRLGDGSRSLEHLRVLKKQNIDDRSLTENVDFLLGRILLLEGHEDEGRSILQSLLSRTVDRLIQSRIHATFGDYYSIKGQRSKAEKSYRIAVEYYPDNLHAAFVGDYAERFKDRKLTSNDSFDLDLNDKKIIVNRDKENQPKTKRSRTKTEPKKKDKPSQKSQSNSAKDNYRENLKKADELYTQGLNLSRKNDFLSALRVYLDAVSVIQDIGPSSDSDYRAVIRKKLSRLYYRIGEAYSALDDRHLAITYYDRVLEIADSSLHQAVLLKKGILYFDSHDYQSAYQNFNRAVEEFPDGSYTKRAEEWLNETDNFLKGQTP